MSFLENREPTPIELEVKSSRDRFDDIVTVLESRGVNLEATLTESEQYQVAYNDLSSWLDCAYDIQVKWKPVGSDLETVRRQYVEHQVAICCISYIKTLILACCWFVFYLISIIMFFNFFTIRFIKEILIMEHQMFKEC